MAIGTATADIRGLREEAERLNRLRQMEQEAAQTDLGSGFQPKPVREGPGAQAMPAAGEEPLRPADTTESPFQQESSAAANRAKLGNDTARLQAKNEKREQNERNSAAVQGVRDLAQKGVDMVGDGLSRAKAAAATALSSKPARQLAAADKEVVHGKGGLADQRRDKQKEAMAERFPDLRDQYNELIARGESGLDDAGNPYSETTNPYKKMFPTFEDFLAESLDLDPTQIGDLTEEELAAARNAAGTMSDPSMKQKEGFQGVEVPIADGVTREDAQGRARKNNARYNDKNESAYDDKHMRPNTPAELQPSIRSSANPLGGKGGGGSRHMTGMDMGPAPEGEDEGEAAATKMMEGMNPNSWAEMDESTRMGHVMYLADRLGVDLTGIPEDQQYYAAKRVVFEHLFKTGDSATKIWANEEADLGHSRDVMRLHGRRSKSDPDYKAFENKFNDNTGQWEIHQTKDSKDRATDRAAKIHAAKNIAGQPEEFLGEDGMVDKAKVEAAVLEAAGLTGKPREDWSFEEETTFKRMMASVAGMQQKANVNEQNRDRGRGQLAMGNQGNSIQWRQRGEMLRKLDAAETDAEKAEILAQMGEDPTFYENRASAQLEADTRRYEAEQAALGEMEPMADPEVDPDAAPELNSYQGQMNRALEQIQPSSGEVGGPQHRQDAARHVIRERMAGLGDTGAALEDPVIKEALGDMLKDEKRARSYSWSGDPNQPADSKDNKAALSKFVNEALDMLGIQPGSHGEEVTKPLQRKLTEMWLRQTGLYDEYMGGGAAEEADAAAQAEPAAPAEPAPSKKAQQGPRKGNGGKKPKKPGGGGVDLGGLAREAASWATGQINPNQDPNLMGP